MTSEAPSPKQTPPKKEPMGPGLLIILGLFLLGLAAYCFADLFIRGKPAEWQEEGNWWYIPLNWAVMVVAFAIAAYSFVLAAIRSRKKAAAPPAEPSGEG